MIAVINIPGAVSQVFDFPSQPDSRAPSERIWQNWLALRTEDLVHRSGLIYCGAYPQLNHPGPPVARFDLGTNQLIRTGINLEHPETVSDHVRSCVNLVRLMSYEWPELFGCGLDYHSPADCPPLVTLRDRLALLFEFHDFAEAVTGDRPDDGNRNEQDKNAEELRIVYRLSAMIPAPAIRRQLICDFVNFQYPLAANLYDGWTPADGRLIQFARLIDKGETVLSTIRCEFEGHPGRLEAKPEHGRKISDQDRIFQELCDSDLISDTWAAHFIVGHHHYHGFEYFLRVLYAAIIDVRGQWYPWWGRLRETYPGCADLPRLDPEDTFSNPYSPYFG